MKKIVFIQKEDGSTYDPVSTFFANKKAQSAAKAIRTTLPSQNIIQKVSQKNIIETKKNSYGQSMSKLKKQSGFLQLQKQVPVSSKKQQGKAVTGKIGRKGDHIPPPRNSKNNPPLNVKQQESIYKNTNTNYNKRIDNRPASNNHLKKQIKQEIIQTPNFEEEQTFSNNIKQQEDNQYEDSRPGTSKQFLPSISQNGHNNNNKKLGLVPSNEQKKNPTEELIKNKKRVKELEQLEKYYISKIEELQAKQEKYVKNEQKLNSKLQKQAKSNTNQAKQLSKNFMEIPKRDYFKITKQIYQLIIKLLNFSFSIKSKLSEKQQQIQKLMSKEDIAYNKKREVLLNNKINQLKKINRQLTARIKNYKGTDLVQISIQHNKTDILNEYEKVQNLEDQQGCNHIDLNRLETLLYRFSNQIGIYLKQKTGSGIKNNQSIFMEWNREKKMLLNLSEVSKNISIQFLKSKDSEFKIPSSNDDFSKMNIFNQIERYKNSLESVMSKSQLNFIISQQNIQIINKMEENSSYIQVYKQQNLNGQNKNQSFISKQNTKKFKKINEAVSFYQNKIQQSIKIYEKYIGYLQLLISKSIVQNSFLNSLSKKFSNQQQQYTKALKAMFKQIEDLCQLNDSANGALQLYLTQNISILQQNVNKITNIDKVLNKKINSHKKQQSDI